MSWVDSEQLKKYILTALQSATVLVMAAMVNEKKHLKTVANTNYQCQCQQFWFYVNWHKVSFENA